MNNLLYIIAVILVIAWHLGLAIGGQLIHILLFLAVISVIFRIIKGGTFLAEFQSLVGQEIEGPEFIEIVSNPDFKQLIHKNEVAFVTYDPKNNTNMLKYTLTTRSGAKITISATQLDSLVKQLDYTTLKIV